MIINPLLLYLALKESDINLESFDWKIPLWIKIILGILLLGLLALCGMFIYGFIKFVIL